LGLADVIRQKAERGKRKGIISTEIGLKTVTEWLKTGESEKQKGKRLFYFFK